MTRVTWAANSGALGMGKGNCALQRIYWCHKGSKFTVLIHADLATESFPPLPFHSSASKHRTALESLGPSASFASPKSFA